MFRRETDLQVKLMDKRYMTARWNMGKESSSIRKIRVKEGRRGEVKTTLDPRSELWEGKEKRGNGKGPLTKR